jgi:putative transposase
VEGVFGDGRETAVCGSPASRRDDGGTLQPFHDKIIVVTHCGRICLGRKRISFSTVFAAQAVGIKEVHDDIWLVSFMDYDLGYFDLDTRVMEPLYNPGPRLSPM